jgi:hypothetical protein
MELRDDASFLAWLSEAGIGIDPRYPTSNVLVFTAQPGLARFWLPTEVPSDLPGFLLTAVRSASKSSGCWAHRRGGGRWFTGVHASSREEVIDRMLIGSGLPGDARGAVHFADSEWQQLLVVLIAHYTLGWHVGNDLHVIPDDRSHVLLLGHHGEMSCHCPDQKSLDTFIAAMAERGFQLPDHVPDSTFKVPKWLEKPRDNT